LILLGKNRVRRAYSEAQILPQVVHKLAHTRAGFISGPQVGSTIEAA
jgi:hypothetical protein